MAEQNPIGNFFFESVTNLLSIFSYFKILLVTLSGNVIVPVILYGS
jgi:hypothetical protein